MIPENNSVVIPAVEEAINEFLATSWQEWLNATAPAF